MNLYFRLIRILFKALWCPKISLLSPSSLKFRVWPFDCDFNLHLTNSRYLSFMDIGRLYYIGQLKVFKTALKQKWTPFVASSEISFIKPVKPMQKITLITELLTWDEKYQYFYQRFTADKTIFATALVKTAIYKQGKVITSKKLIQLMGEHVDAPPMPDSIKMFRQLSATKRRVHG